MQTLRHMSLAISLRVLELTEKVLVSKATVLHWFLKTQPCVLLCSQHFTKGTHCHFSVGRRERKDRNLFSPVVLWCDHHPVVIVQVLSASVQECGVLALHGAP